ncbi:unnamed protein product [Leptosia nina]|uniref:Uncharacterized protein n=1 Tax=Leptosia nina TaxID=320188 RepID=A0AAV1JN14_9NEOP
MYGTSVLELGNGAIVVDCCPFLLGTLGPYARIADDLLGIILKHQHRQSPELGSVYRGRNGATAAMKAVDDEIIDQECPEGEPLGPHQAATNIAVF